MVRQSTTWSYKSTQMGSTGSIHMMYWEPGSKLLLIKYPVQPFVCENRHSRWWSQIYKTSLLCINAFTQPLSPLLYEAFRVVQSHMESFGAQYSSAILQAVGSTGPEYAYIEFLAGHRPNTQLNQESTSEAEKYSCSWTKCTWKRWMPF